MTDKTEKDEAPREHDARESDGQGLTIQYIDGLASAFARIDDRHEWSSGPQW